MSHPLTLDLRSHSVLFSYNWFYCHNRSVVLSLSYFVLLYSASIKGERQKLHAFVVVDDCLLCLRGHTHVWEGTRLRGHTHVWEGTHTSERAHTRLRRTHVWEGARLRGHTSSDACLLLSCLLCLRRHTCVCLRWVLDLIRALSIFPSD